MVFIAWSAEASSQNFAEFEKRTFRHLRLGLRKRKSFYELMQSMNIKLGI
jgi:hypothetical protein